MADDENRTLEGFQLFREPLELLLSNVRRITALVVFRFFVFLMDPDRIFQDFPVAIQGVLGLASMPQQEERLVNIGFGLG